MKPIPCAAPNDVIRLELSLERSRNPNERVLEILHACLHFADGDVSVIRSRPSRVALRDDTRRRLASREPTCALAIPSADPESAGYVFAYDRDDGVVSLAMRPKTFAVRRSASRALFTSLLLIESVQFGHCSLACEGGTRHLACTAPESHWLNGFRGSPAQTVRTLLARDDRPEPLRVVTLDNDTVVVTLVPTFEGLSGRNALRGAYRWFREGLAGVGLAHALGPIACFEEGELCSDEPDACTLWNVG